MGAMLKLLKLVADHIHKEGISHVRTNFLGSHVIKHVYCIFSSPWYVSQTKVIQYEKEESFTVTKNFFNDLIAKEQQQFTESLHQGKYQKIFGDSVELLEKKIISTKLNGYDTPDPIGKKAREIEVTFFMSFISPDLKEKVENILHHAFNFKNIEYNSYALASWSAARDMFPAVQDFLFLDVSGEVTDVSLTANGIIEETVSFPFGRSALIRRVVDTLLVPPEVAVSLLLMYKTGSVEPKFAEKLKNCLEKATLEWFDSFVDMLKGLEKKYQIPKMIYITVDKDLANYFLDTLKWTTPVELNIPQNYFTVVILNEDKVGTFSHYASEIQPDPFLAIDSIFVRKLVSHSL